jgi:hypothetical protein
MSQPNLRAVNLEEAVEEALEAIRAIDPDLVTELPPPPTTPLTAPASDIARARASFANHLGQLKERIAAATADVATATKVRDEAIALASERHAAATAEAEKKLYQATTLLAVIETAHSTLMQARDE